MINKFPVIGIGASAGGLEPLEDFFDKIPVNSGFSYVVIQHLAPNHKSLMDELLARHTQIPISIISDGLEILPNHIYLNPPKKFVEIEEGRFTLSDKMDRELSFPISSFFASLAEHSQTMAAAIILSGTGSDGSEGIKYIKEKGGFVLAQTPHTAKFDGMPKNAIHSNSVDKVLPVIEMHNELARFFSGSLDINLNEEESLKSKLNLILQQILLLTGVDFTGYKYSTVERRILRRLSIIGKRSLEDYLAFISNNPTEAHKLSKELLIGVTRFFRDKEAFEKIRQTVIPQIIEANSFQREIRVWVPSCYTGEEAYSLAILFKEYLRIHKLKYDVTIFATDLDKEAIKIAANRTFPESIAQEVPIELLDTYFTPQKGGYNIHKEIREMILFSQHNLIQDPPFSKIDLLSCRNFLIYLNTEVQQRVFTLFQFALKNNGFLFLGMSESVGEMAGHFTEFDKKYKIYTHQSLKKTAAPIRLNRQKLLLDIASENEEISSPIKTESLPPNPNREIYQEIQESLIQSYVPDALVFTKKFELIYTTGKVDDWLKFPAGEVITNILKMIPDKLSLYFEIMALKVIEDNKTVLLKSVTVEGKMVTVYESEELEIRISPFPIRNGDILLIATFKPGIVKEQVDVDQTEIDLDLSSKEKIGIIDRELRINRENLQTTIEELESSNEELQASNEELESSNEELESVNEELCTVNAEYQEKVNELSDSNNDLLNLIQSTDIAILFLDENLHIRRYTPAIKKVLQLTPQDIGRHISHFKAKIQLEDLIAHIEKVLFTQYPFESTIKDSQDNDFILRITCFKTQKKDIKGIVLSFVNITQITQTQKALQISNKELSNISYKYNQQSELFELIAKNARDMISVITLEGQPEYSSPSTYELTGYSPDEFCNLNMMDHIEDEKDQKQWQEVMDSLHSGTISGLLLYKFITKKRQARWFESTFQKIKNSQDNLNKVLINTRDVHQRTLLNDEVKTLSMIFQQTSNSIIITNKDGEITFVNDAFEKITGYKEEDILGKKPADFLQGEESDPEVLAIMSEAIKNVKPFDVDLINYNSSGNKYWVHVQAEPMFDSKGEHSGFFSIQADISPKKDYESQISTLNEYLNDQNIKLEQINKSLDEFAYVASHDMKAPIRNIKTMLQIIEKKENIISSEEKKEYFKVAIDASTELGNLVDNLLEYSRSGRIEEDIKDENLINLIKGTIAVYKHELNAVEGTIKLNLQPETIRVYPILFKRLIGNLLSNAIKYRSDQKPEISITSYVKDDKIKFEMTDNGIGIAEKRQKDIFKIFSRIEKRSDNNGIGLSLCKKITEIHGGEIWIESQLGKGSTFHFEIKKSNSLK